MKNASTMSLSKNRASLVFLLFLVTFISNAQLVQVKDTAFAKGLCQAFSEVMDGTCTNLDTNVAKANYSDSPVSLRLFGRGIINVDELVYFTGLDTIFFNENDISSFPDLENFPNMHRLQLAANDLEIAPNINFEGNGNLQYVFLRDNKITELPGWDAPNSIIIELSIKGNELTEIPDFSQYTSLNLLNVNNNRLKFSHLVPILSCNNYNQPPNFWNLFPQKPFFVMGSESFDLGEKVSIEVPQDHKDNTYYLKKAGVRVDASSDGTFSFNATKDLEGFYTIEIRNSNFLEEEEFLESEPFKLSLNEIPLGDNVIQEDKEIDIYLFSPDGDGIGDFLTIEGAGGFKIFNVNGDVLLTEKLPFKWDGRDSYGNVLGPDMYYIQTDYGLKKVLISF